jgi:hypothetical protein
MDTTSQAITGLTQVAVVWLVLLVGSSVVNFNKDISKKYKTLIPYTIESSNGEKVIQQDIKTFPDTAIPLGLSVNERTGIEFAYSFYLFINSDTVDSLGSARIQHILHKGHPSPYPMMGPGVFFEPGTSSLLVFMNTYANPFSFCRVKNFPTQKWVHVVLNCYRKGLDVYVNGVLGNRIPFINTIPYQNYGEVHIFSKATKTVTPKAMMPTGEDFNLGGSISGSMSLLRYSSYALSVSEVQKLMARGPSKQLEPIATRSVSMYVPPYFADDWWSNQR